MPTDCIPTLFEFAPVKGCKVVANFDGGAITSDASGLLLGATDKVLGLLAGTPFATATCGTIRLRLLKIGALVRISVRRVAFAMASGCPWQTEFALVHAVLRRAGA